MNQRKVSIFLRNNIPNGITIINLISGFTAILLNNPYWSPVFILFGSFADLFDGFFARKLQSRSKIGKELDSLADLITFGVAPAYLYFFHVMKPESWSYFFILFIPVFSAIRLAIFNVDTEQKTSFKGLPTPATGLFFASMVFNKFEGGKMSSLLIENHFIVAALPVIFGFLMVFPVKLFSLKNQSKKQSIIPLSFIAISSVLLVIFRLDIVPVIIILYVIFSVVGNQFNRRDTV